MSDKKQEFKKENFVILAFSRKQMFHEHAKDGRMLVNVALPSAAEHKGYYMTIDKDSLKDDKFRKKMVYVYLHKDGEKKVTLYNKQSKERHEILLGAQALKEEFDSWRSKEEKEVEKNVTPVYIADPEKEYEDYLNEEKEEMSVM